MMLSNQVKDTLIIFLLTCSWPSDSIAQPQVTIPQGTLLGTTLTTRRNRTIDAFQGIPYGQPPTGDLRFANPVAADGWNGTLNATGNGNICLQLSSGVGVGDEDCLNLNVYTPQLTDDSSPTLLPVMVWIYGGSFLNGSAAVEKPDYLLDTDIVLAIPNYRLGPFGFLSTGDEVASGNWGLKDMVLALKWVQNNIEYFGGDPNRVTLAGQSAGAAGVQLLTLSKAARGLFNRYITESGTALAQWIYRPSGPYSRRAYELAEYVGCSNNTSTSLINCLRKTSASDILATYPRYYFWKNIPPGIWFATDEPDIEGAILTDSPANLIAAGDLPDLPWLGGVNQDEGLVVTTDYYLNKTVFAEFLDNFDNYLPIMLLLTDQPDSGAAWTAAIKSFYFNDVLTPSDEVLANLTIVVSDLWFFYPIHSLLKKQLARGVDSPQYFYSFNYLGNVTSSLPIDHLVGHGAERWYLFPSTAVPSTSPMIDTMVQLWTSFVINGTPISSANDNTVTWESYSAEDNYLRIGTDSNVSLEVQYSFFKKRMQFWATLHSEMDTLGTTTTSAEFEYGGTQQQP